MYLQTNTYKRIARDQRSEEEFCTKRHICVSLMNKRAEKKIYYDKSLKVHFESPETFRTFEIEIKDIRLRLDKQYRKAQDFLSRLNYKYDWIQVEQNNNGNITGIENIEELRSNWLLLRKRLEKDYNGITVEQYLNNIANRFSEDTHFKDIFGQYNEYGLLFPNIPQKHRSNWTGMRNVYLDSNPKSKVCELLTLGNVDERYKTYNIYLKQDEQNSLITITDCIGILKYDVTHNRVHSADLRVKYNYDEYIINEYHYCIENTETDNS